MGIEALSRGASHVCFVDNDRRCCDIIRCNLEELRLSERAYVIRCDAAQPAIWGEAAARELGEGKLTIVYADPPYKHEKIAQLPEIIAVSPAVSVDAILVFEHDDGVDMPCEAGLFRIYKEKRYGGTTLSFYKTP
jgi:16S rRNA (guanine(966)-N(2))-methyltransferase RsmD